MRDWHSGKTFEPIRGLGRRAEPPITFRDPSGERGRGLQDVLFTLKGDVAAHHVEEQDAQRPKGERTVF